MNFPAHFVNLSDNSYNNIIPCAQLLSHVGLLTTPWTIAHKTPLSMEFFRQEYQSGLPFPPPEDLPDPVIKSQSPASSALAGRFFTTCATKEAPSFPMLLLLSHFSCVLLCVTPWMQPTRLLCPWDSPGKNTGVGCHFLLQCMKMESESEVAQLCLTLSDPMDCSLPGSSIHGIFQATVLEWGAIAFSHHSLYKALNFM